MRVNGGSNDKQPGQCWVSKLVLEMGQVLVWELSKSPASKNKVCIKKKGCIGYILWKNTELWFDIFGKNFVIRQFIGIVISIFDKA